MSVPGFCFLFNFFFLQKMSLISSNLQSKTLIFMGFFYPCLSIVMSILNIHLSSSAKQGVQPRQVLVVNFFIFLKLNFFFPFAVQGSKIVHVRSYLRV